nr:DUF4167 domain-containing protein [uncultured Sphingomonas sp.]
MINNRQSGRRRGRGGQRPQGMGGNSGNAARDNRQRGNAAQLLEKYKNLARDAQLAGDRVQTEYYLQFADHYFRVLEDNRSRYEEQQAHRRRRDDDEDDGDEDITVEADNDSGDEEGEAPVRERRPRNRERPQRQQRANNDGDADRGGENGERIAVSALPPAIGAADSEDESDVAEEKPRRRTRRPRVKDEGDPAAAE